MRAPRRTPWSGLSELAELYEMLFSPISDALSRRQALSRMGIYTASPSCPAFMHILQDLVSASLLPTQTSEQGAAARLACAMAVVRFVNGMVDPLQTGPYARPIAHLAATLGIPQSLISLRHRATHEDLPPLSTLLTAVFRCIEYIQRYSLLPLLSAPSTSAGPSSVGGVGVSGIGGRAGVGETRAEALVNRWKKVVKARVRARDVSVESESGREVKRLKREVEDLDVDEVVDAIVRIGLVPVARKKRPSSKSKRPSEESIQIWAPLLVHLSTFAPTLSATFATSLFSSISNISTPRAFSSTASTAIATAPVSGGSGGSGGTGVDVEVESWRWTLATWLIWVWGGGIESDGIIVDDALVLGRSDKMEIWRTVSRQLVHSDPLTQRLYRAMVSIDPVGPTDLDRLVNVDSVSDPADPTDDVTMAEEKEGMGVEADAMLAKMEAHLRALDKMGNRGTSARTKLVETGGKGRRVDKEEVEGWVRVEMVRPVPIGMWISG